MSSKQINQAPTGIFLGDLSISCTEQTLHDLFIKFGEITEVNIVKSSETKKSLQYGFIKFKNENHALNAMLEMNGKQLQGRNMM